MRPTAISILLVTLAAARADAAFVSVTSTADSGPGSLRQALLTAAPGDTIVFALPPTPQVIVVNTELGLKRHVTLLGPGSARLTIQKNPSSGKGRVFIIDTAINAVISGITISGGSEDRGGCVFHGGADLTVSSVVIRGCTATTGIARGGALFASATSGSLHVLSSNITNNSAGIGGGIAVDDGTTPTEIIDSVVSSNTASAGGGVYMAGSTLLVKRARFEGNTAVGGGTGGGGLYVTGGVSQAVVTDSAFVSNAATGDAGMGGGINAPFLRVGELRVDRSLFDANSAQLGGGINVAENGAVARISNSTFTQNLQSAITAFSAGVPGGATLYLDANTFALNGVGVSLFVQTGPVVAVIRNSLFWGNSASFSGTGTVWSVGHNLASDAPPAFTGVGDLVDTDALLGPLADNGGPTLTFALDPASPALNAGTCDAFLPVGGELTVDQRGEPRPFGGECDIGAFELVVRPSGPAGPAGDAGPQGEPGPAGPQGDAGPPGEPGATGAPGETGPAGPQGSAGTNGTNGANGTNGTNGTDGMAGAQGPRGPAGVSPLVEVRDEPPGATCPAGGLTVVAGFDDGAGGAAAGDGVLSEAEIDSRSHVCNSVATKAQGCSSSAEALNWLAGSALVALRLRGRRRTHVDR